MAGTATNVLVGAPSTFKIAAYLASKAVSLTYVDVGFTMGGVMFDPKTELHMVTVDQNLGQLAAIPKAREMEIKVKLEESNLANLQYGFAQVTGNLSGTSALFVDASAAEINYQLQIVGKGIGATAVRTVTVWKAFIKDMGSWAFKKDAPQEVDLTFGVLEETTGATTATYMRIIET